MAAIPDDILDLKNTHLMEWLPQADIHFKHGSKDWCMAYINSAVEYIAALERHIEGLPDVSTPHPILR